MSPANCIFCDIVEGRMPCFKIYEDERSLAFLDINPVAPGHTLVIPKNHHENMFKITPGDLAGVHQACQKVAVALKRVTEADGITMMQLNGAAAGQVVMHYHVHLIPRREGDGLGMAHGGEPADKASLAALAEKITEAV